MLGFKVYTSHFFFPFPYLISSDHNSNNLPMIGNSLVDYISIRLSITALRLIAPTSIVYLVFSFFRPEYFAIPIGVVAVPEALFYLFVYLPRRGRLQAVRLFLGFWSPVPLQKYSFIHLLHHSLQHISHHR